MFNPTTLFKPKTDAQRNLEIITKAENLREFQDLATLGKDMLNDERYKKLKQNFDVLFGKLLRDLIQYSEPDNNKYAVNIRVMLTRIQSLLSLIDTPTNFLNYITVQKFELEEKEKKEE